MRRHPHVFGDVEANDLDALSALRDRSAVAIRVAVWQGTADRMVPPHHAEQLAARLPKATLTMWDGEGHLGTITHVGEVLDTFV